MRDVVDEIVVGIFEREMFDFIIIVGFGFINFCLFDNYICLEFFREIKSVELGFIIKRYVLVDFFFLNIVKEMYVGYFCSIIIGDIFCNVFEFCGYIIICVNYVGDWGI